MFKQNEVVRLQVEARRNCPRNPERIPGSYVSVRCDDPKNPTPPYFQNFNSEIDTIAIFEGFCKTDLCFKLGFCRQSYDGSREVKCVGYRKEINYGSGADARRTEFRKVEDVEGFVKAIKSYVEAYMAAKSVKIGSV